MTIKQTGIWKFFSSVKLAIWLLSIIAVLSLIGTFIPQNQEAALYIERYGQLGYRALLSLGLTDIYSAWYFILSLILFSLNLSVCLLNRLSFKMRSLGTMLSHFSILVILLGAMIGMLFGQKGFIEISKGEEVDSFLSRNGQQVNLGFRLKLNDFIYTEYIDPKEKLFVCSSLKEAVCMMQGPHGQEKAKGIIAEISPEIGVEAETAIADTGYKIKVLRYLPDFVMDTSMKVAVSRSAQPNNPAIEVELKDKEGKAKTFWVFARFPDIHQEIDKDFKFIYHWVGRRPKDFISKVTILKDGQEIMRRDIRVNEPLRFSGYTFFQSSYDNEGLNWSGLQVVKDPGVPVIYAGFILLISGLVMIFYLNPLIKYEVTPRA